MTKDEVLFHQVVNVYDLSWTLRQGIKLTLQLAEEEHIEPLRQLPKKSKKHSVILLMYWRVGGERWRKLEVWYLGYSISSGAGAKVRVELSDEDDFRAFLHLGPDSSIEIVLAELDEDGTIVNQAQRDKLAALPGGPRSKAAARLCKEPLFQEFAASRGGVPETEAGAADFIRARLEIESRAQLDHDDLAYQRFKEYIQKPYMHWPKFKAAHVQS